MDQFIQTAINGLMLGGFYGVMVLGFSVIWGVMGVINLAHGEFVMLGAYMAWFLNTRLSWDPFLAPLVVIPVMFALGYILQRVLINRIVEGPHLISLLVSFGLGIMMANIVKLIFAADPRITETVLSGFWPVGSVTIPKTKSGILVAALIIMSALHLFLQRTRLGKSIRAAAQNKEAARMVGIEIKTVYALTFAICIALTGVAGVLISPTQAIFPFMGAPLTIRAFAITALAGLGSVFGALAGGIFLAMIEVFVASYVPGVGTNMGTVISFVLLVTVLVVRPQGLLGGLKPATEVQ